MEQLRSLILSSTQTRLESHFYSCLSTQKYHDDHVGVNHLSIVEVTCCDARVARKQRRIHSCPAVLDVQAPIDCASGGL